MFKIFLSDSVSRFVFNVYFIANMFLCIIALRGFASGAGLFSTLTGLMYIVIVSMLSLNVNFRKSNFSVWLCFLRSCF